MRFKTITKQKLPLFVASGLFALMTSCGSFQYAGYDNDGIYGTDEYQEEVIVEQPVATTSTSDSNYYKNYFAENSAELNAFTEESEIFTDIDSYEGNYLERAQDTLEQRPAYGGWGTNSDNVTINIIDNGWYGWNNPWFYGGWGWNNWGWGRPWGYYNNWSWSWGINRFGYNPGWAWGWNNWGWNDPYWYFNSRYGYYGWNNRWIQNGYYRNNGISYINSRRGSLLSNSNISTRRGRSNAAISRRDYSTSRLSRAVRNNGNSRISRSNSSTRSIGTSRSSRTPRSIRSSNSRSNPRVTRPSTSRSSGTVRSSRSSRSSGSVRSSRSSSSRSSGSVRSSGSSRSSSGGSRSSSGGGSRRGRG